MYATSIGHESGMNLSRKIEIPVTPPTTMPEGITNAATAKAYIALPRTRTIAFKSPIKTFLFLITGFFIIPLIIINVIQ
jgi:hypothetical protein